MAAYLLPSLCCTLIRLQPNLLDCEVNENLQFFFGLGCSTGPRNANNEEQQTWGHAWLILNSYELEFLNR